MCGDVMTTYLCVRWNLLSAKGWCGRHTGQVGHIVDGMKSILSRGNSRSQDLEAGKGFWGMDQKQGDAG